MGRPIQKARFGEASLTVSKIVVDAVKFADGTTATDAYIIKQTGTNSYVVQDSAKLHVPEIVEMVNANALTDLKVSQCFITAIPFGGTALPCAKITQFKLTVFDADGTIDAYVWATSAATRLGQATLNLSSFH